jgi:hypothetical protein
MKARSGPAAPRGFSEGGPTGWRSRLTGHPALEPLLFVSLALLYIWLVRPTRSDLLKGPMLAVIVLIPFISVFLHRDALREMGLRVDNLIVSARDVGLVTLLGAVIVLGIGLLAGARPRLHAGLLDDFLLYPLWGIVQQFAMQAFTYRRLREGIGGVAASAILTAFLFAAVHYPNLALALATAAGSYVWCRLFERQPNLITLALSHGWLAVLLRYSWPAAWLHNLRIGPGYWTWTP